MNKMSPGIALCSIFALALQPTASLAKQPRKNHRQAATYTDARAYCRAKVNVDYQRENFDPPSGYVGENPPPLVLGADRPKEGTVWRCMDGKIYTCYFGAGGRACAKQDPSLVATRAMREYCAANPNDDFIPMSVVDVSSSSWACAGNRPTITQTFQLDARSYLADAWKLVN